MSNLVLDFCIVAACRNEWRAPGRIIPLLLHSAAPWPFHLDHGQSSSWFLHSCCVQE
jgi:hypothetical protein